MIDLNSALDNQKIELFSRYYSLLNLTLYLFRAVNFSINKKFL